MTKRGEINNAGTGDSTYLQYDTSNADQACQWLAKHRNDQNPWVLFLSFVCPHPPYISPEEFYQLYSKDQIPLPAQWHIDEWPRSSRHRAIPRFFHLFWDLRDEERLRNFLGAYYGVCTYLDQQIGRESCKPWKNIIYLIPAGLFILLITVNRLAARGLFGKFTMYDESAAVPFYNSRRRCPKKQSC